MLFLLCQLNLYYAFLLKMQELQFDKENNIHYLDIVPLKIDIGKYTLEFEVTKYYVMLSIMFLFWQISQRNFPTSALSFISSQRVPFISLFLVTQHTLHFFLSRGLTLLFWTTKGIIEFMIPRCFSKSFFQLINFLGHECILGRLQFKFWSYLYILTKEEHGCVFAMILSPTLVFTL